MNIYILYHIDSGELYGSPFNGGYNGEWSNFPVEGLGVIGGISEGEASDFVKDAYVHPYKYLVVNGEIVEKPYIKGSVEDVDGKFTITVTSFGGENTEFHFKFLGMDVVANSLAIDVHKVVKNKNIEITIEADGFLSDKVVIGGADTNVSTLACVGQEDGSIFIKSISKQEITYYYMTHTVSQSDIMTDLANWVDLLTSIIMRLIETSTTAFTIQEQAAITDITQNLLPILRLKLSDATLDSLNPRYTQIVNQKQQANTNADEFLALIQDPDVR